MLPCLCTETWKLFRIVETMPETTWKPLCLGRQLTGNCAATQSFHASPQRQTLETAFLRDCGLTVYACCRGVAGTSQRQVFQG